MSFSEQADSSAERTENTGIYEQMIRERDTVGSTREYVRVLGIYYESVPEHRANMLQLQRMATVLTNPVHEPTFPKRLTDAFYWGEILAYASQDRLIGDDWADASYRLFNEAIVAKLAELRDNELPYGNNLLQVAATIAGELEVADETSMPPSMDQFIIEWAGQVTDDEEQQWQMILGFRHVIMEVVQKALADDGSENARDNVMERARISNEFFSIIDDTEIDDVQGIEMEPINDVRDRVMESYGDHLVAYGSYDETNEDEVGSVGMYLTQAVNRDFRKMEGIEAEDFLRIGGNAVFISFDEELQPQAIYMLSTDEFLEGTTDMVGIVEVPSMHTMMRLQEHDVDEDELAEDSNPLGVVLLLKDPVLIDSEGGHIQLGANRVAGLVLNNPDMDMWKYLL